MSTNQRWLITGAAGAIGLQVIKRIFLEDFAGITVVATDVRLLPSFLKHPSLSFAAIDVRSEDARKLIIENNFDVIIHLASIVSPGKKSNRDFEYSVDVLGTKNVLEAAEKSGVKHIIVSSSGAAYGYHADLPEWISEEEPVRGNEVFAYSWHKKLVEDMMMDARKRSPQLKQLILRPGTVLGDMMKNQITDLFAKPVVIGLKESDSPFVFIWDQDVAEIIYQGAIKRKEGIYNLAGDGKVTNVELAQILKKPLLRIPASCLKAALSILKALNLTQYGPDQVAFLQYRPVLANKNLKENFPFQLRKTSKEVLLNYLHPEKKYYIRSNGKIDPSKIFMQESRLDVLVWDIPMEEEKVTEMQEWIDFFQAQRSGTIFSTIRHPMLEGNPYVRFITANDLSKYQTEWQHWKAVI
jgi:UDP-glucose 4-epimerase